MLLLLTIINDLDKMTSSLSLHHLLEKVVKFKRKSNNKKLLEWGRIKSKAVLSRSYIIIGLRKEDFSELSYSF